MAFAGTLIIDKVFGHRGADIDGTALADDET